jgi:hypothetical protein
MKNKGIVFMDEKCIRCVLQKEETKKGVKRYIEIMRNFQTVDVSSDKDFQRKFKNFYKIRRNEQFLEVYYSFLQRNKNKNPSFIEVLNKLYKFGKLEASFASKLLATIDPKLPIWDKYVLEHFRLNPPSRLLPKEERIKQANNVYEDLKKSYRELLNKEESKLVIKLFNEYYPDNKITSIKKIDFIIWQSR